MNYFKLVSDNPKAIYIASIKPIKNDAPDYNIKITGREIFSTEIAEEIKVLKADSMVRELNKKEVYRMNEGKQKINKAVFVEPKPLRPMTKAEEKAEAEKK